ncbi:creatinine amidohydrolase [Modicisalibacter ilicicola DSM 19980]|uniref:Creatinine amidohydrolase n=1 Tax=Modicisalibacter ilicicola DSM 19980 TaxID=1121942 RepID=A0A1M4XZY8_9GAMM|nr:creatininase family protein [Halomonas ilicicola]SHE98906.1 creatinine amidohydrolase [Halomonas ilicicola DSM 19980]
MTDSIEFGARRWQDMTSPELSGVITEESVAVLPLAAIEQHGAHLPLSTDLDIGLGLLAAATALLPETFALFELPPLAIGSSQEHGSFAGTLSLPPETAIAVIEAYGDSLARSGVRRLVLLNSHGGNKAVADIAALKLRERRGMLVVKAHYMRFSPPPGALPEKELRHGLHGGALETAMMLHLAPHKVRREHVGHPPSRGEAMAARGKWLGPEGEAAFAWLAEDLHPGGVVGDARLADAELGARLVEHYASKLATLFEEASTMGIDDFQSREGRS